MSNEFPLTKEQFSEWLASREDDEIVGVSMNPGCCPLATACAMTAYPITVLSHRWEAVDHTQWGWLPLWAERFVRVVDFRRDKHQIRADEAREIFGMVEVD